MDNLYFYDIDMKNSELWFPEYETGLIFKGELGNDNFHALSRNMYRIFKEYPLFLGICSCKDKVLLARYKDRNMIVYDKNKNLFLNYEVHNLPAEAVLDFKHDSVFEYKNNYYIILSHGEIIYADQELKDFEYILSVPRTKEARCVCQMPEAGQKIYISMGNKIYTFLPDEKALMEFATADHDIETFCFDETSLWISTDLGELICIDKNETLHIEEEKMPLIVERPNARKFWKSFYCNSTIWLIPCYAENILYADLNNKMIYSFVIDGEEESRESISRVGRKNKQKIISAIQINNELLVLSSKTEKLYKIDMLRKKIQNIELHFDKNALVYEKMQNDKIWIEGTAGIGIREYIELFGGDVMKIDCLYKQFIEVEDKYDLFSSTLNGIKIWQFMRTYVSRELIEDISGLILVGLNRKAVNTKNKQSFMDSLRTNPYLVHKKDLLIVGLSRRVYDGKYYIDSFTDEIIKHLKYSYYLYEDSYMGEHFTPVRVRNIKYNDKYIPITRKSDFKDINKKAKKWLDGILKILEKEFDRKLNVTRQKRLFAVLISFLTTYDWSYRKYCEYILDMIRPKAVIVVCSPIISNMILIEEAKRRKIPTIELAHGMMDDYNPAYNTLRKRDMKVYPDYIFTFGEYDKLIANYPIDSRNVIPIGYAELEKNFKRYKKERSSKKIRITFLDGGSDALCKYVCYLSQRLDLSKYTIILKLHPMQYDSWREQYPKLVDIPVKVIDNNMHDVHYYINNSDYVIGIATTALYEATLYSCHIGIIAEENYIFSKSLYEQGHALLIHEKEELVDFVTGKIPFEPKEANYFKKNAVKNFNMELNKIIISGKKD